MPRKTSNEQPHRWIGVAVLVLSAGLASTVRGDLKGLPDQPQALSATEAEVVVRNPALEALAARSPWVLRVILDVVAAPPSTTAKSPAPLDVDDTVLLRDNSALMQVYRASPEAAADLLALIRTAGEKPRK